nr:glycosyltransferase family 1 protein [Desulfobacterales bacterium]
MNVLMIGIGAQVITGLGGDAQERHIEYAKRAGSLTMIVSSFRHDKLKPVRLSEHLMAYPTNSRNKPLFLWDAYQIGIRICRREKIDLIVTQDPFSTGLVGYLLKRRFSTPLIISNHSFFLDNPYWLAEKPLQYFLFNQLGKRLIHKADGLRVVNRAEKEKYIALGVPPERIWFLPTPVSIEHFITYSPSKELTTLCNRWDLHGKRILLWVGHPRQAFKDLETLFQAFRKVIQSIEEVKLILLGDFSQAPHHVYRVRELGLQDHVIFPGLITYRELPLYYHLCDLYVHSSRYEGLAKVMVEAAASAKAIVSTRIPGIDDIVQEGLTGLLAPIEDSDTLAGHILCLLKNPDQAKRMGDAAKQFVQQRFRRETMINAIVRMWRQVVCNYKR